MLRLLSYNIHGGIGRDGREDAGRVLEVIRRADADVVALQEVYDDPSQDSSFVRALEQLGYPTVVHGPVLRRSRGAYGNVMMARRKALEIQRIDLDVGGAEPRGAIRLQLELPGGRLDVCGTHLGLSGSERWRQLRLLEEQLSKVGERDAGALQVLMGDLNEWRPGTRFMRAVRQRFPHLSRCRTFPARRPWIALDRIGLRGPVGQVSFRRLDNAPADRASDHRPIVADVVPAE